MSELEFTEGTFDATVAKGKGPAMVDLWAPWCGPCRAMAPVVAELAAEFDGRVVVGKLNTDEHGAVAVRLQVSAIPTLLFFQDGRLVDRLVGMHPKAAVRERLETLLARGS